MRVRQAVGGERGLLSRRPGDDRAFGAFADSVGAEADRKGRIGDTPIPVKGA